MNLFDTSNTKFDEECFEPLILDKGILIERIVSTGQASPPDFWYNQERDEWVAVLQGQAQIVFKDGQTIEMGPGDWILIPAHKEHQVEWTSSEPPCIWLAIHAKLV